MSQYFPSVVQVIPFEDYTVDIYFDDGKIVTYDVQRRLPEKIFERIQSAGVFIRGCMVLNVTLAWDIAGGRDESQCIDIDPLVLYELPRVAERIA